MFTSGAHLIRAQYHHFQNYTEVYASYTIALDPNYRSFNLSDLDKQPYIIAAESLQWKNLSAYFLLDGSTLLANQSYVIRATHEFYFKDLDQAAIHRVVFYLDNSSTSFDDRTTPPYYFNGVSGLGFKVDTPIVRDLTFVSGSFLAASTADDDGAVRISLWSLLS